MLALTFVTLAGCGGPTYLGRWAEFESHDAVRGLPAIARIDAAEAGGRTSMVLRGHVSRERARHLADMATRVYADVNRRFVGGSSVLPRPPVDVCIFDTMVEYKRFVRRVRHYQNPSSCKERLNVL